MSTTGAAGPAGREGQPGPAGREGTAGQQGPKGATGAEGAEGPEGVKGHVGMTGPVGPPGPTGAIVDLTTAQKDLAAAVRLLYREVRRLIAAVVLCIVAVVGFGALHLRLSQQIGDEGEAGRQSFKCVVAVLFRLDPPLCPNAKEDLIRDGIIPPGFPVTTTTTR